MSKLILLKELFTIENGISSNLVKVNLSKMERTDIPFIRPSNLQENSIAGYIERFSINEKSIYAKDTLYIGTNGEGSHSFSYVCPFEFVANSDVSILIPKIPLSIIQKNFYALCLTKNRYKFNYGRKPKGKRLREILVPHPDNIPDWVNTIEIPCPPSTKSLSDEKLDLNSREWKSFYLNSIFNIESSRDKVLVEYSSGKTPYIASTAKNNGIIDYIDRNPTNLSGTITINSGGSVGECFYQPRPYIATPVDVRIIQLKEKSFINPFLGMFLTTLVKKEKFRFNYSRKMGTQRLKNLSIKLPVDAKGNPDWQFMEDYIKSLPYSSNLKS